MLKKDYSNVIIFILVVFLGIILIYPTFVIHEVQTALSVFITKYFPAVFPIYIITDLLINYHFPEKMARFLESFCKRVLHCNGNCAFVIIMSMVSGFPSGAKYTKALLQEKSISLSLANYLITFTHFSNPLFILGTCFLITKNRMMTIFILICHFFANFIIAFLVRPKWEEGFSLKERRPSKSFIVAFTDSIFATFKLMFLILGTSIIFFLFSGIVTSSFHMGSFSYLVTGLLELTKGIQMIPVQLSVLFKAITILFFLSFGSLSIHMQVLSIIKDTGICYRYFLLGRICQAGISILLFLLFHFFGFI